MGIPTRPPPVLTSNPTNPGSMPMQYLYKPISGFTTMHYLTQILNKKYFRSNSIVFGQVRRCHFSVMFKEIRFVDFGHI